MKTQIIRVTPELAEFLLEQPKNMNRPLNRRAVVEYTEQMKAGAWKLTGQGISVLGDIDRLASGEYAGHEYVLLNGQHRLRAILASHASVDFLFIEEVSADSFSVFDIGRTRTAASILAIEGVHNTSLVAATARLVTFYDTCPGDIWSKRISQAEVVDWYQRADHRLLEGAVSSYHSFVSKSELRGASSWWAAFYYIVHRDSPNAARWHEFADAVITGTYLAPGDPRLALRNQIINRVRGSEVRSGGGWARQRSIGLAIAAWNLWLDDQKRGYLKFTQASLPMQKVK